MPILRTGRQRSWWRVRYAFEDIFGLYLVSTVIGFVLVMSSAVFFEHSSTYTSARAETRESLNAVFAAQESPDDRRQLAESLIEIEQSGGHTGISYGVETDGTEYANTMAAVEQVAETGDTLDLDTDDTPDWSIFWYSWIVAVLGLILPTLHFVPYLLWTRHGNEYLADLDWRSVWSYVFVAMTALPIWWIFYLVSFVKVHRAKKQRDAQDQLARNRDNAGPGNQDRAMDIEEDFDRFVDNDVRDTSTYRFHHSPFAAEEFFGKLRREVGTVSLQRELHNTEQSLEQVEYELGIQGEELRELQRRRRELKAGVSNLHEQVEAARDLTTVDDATITSEFSRLMNMQGLTAIRVIDEQISLLVKPRFELNGTTYDLGDWDVRFGADGHLATKELRRGVRESWYGGYPVYRNGGSFCFGNHAYRIREYLTRGQFVEAIELAIAAMHTINDEDRVNVREAFHVAEESE